MLCIIGPGGVGGLLAVLLADRPDFCVVARPQTADLIRGGIELESAQFGARRATPRVVTEVPEGARVIIATKAEALPHLSIPNPAEVISLLNGVSHRTQIEALGRRAACGAIRVVSERVRPGLIRHYSPFTRIDLPVHAADFELVGALADAGVDVRVGGTTDQVLWNKLAFLAPMALLTAATGLPLGPALDARDSEGLAAEIEQLGRACGAEVSGEGSIAFLRSVNGEDTSSLARDVARGHRGELGPLGEDLVDMAGTLGVEVPILRGLVDEIRTKIEKIETI